MGLASQRRSVLTPAGIVAARVCPLITIGLMHRPHLFPLPAVFLTGPALATGSPWVTLSASWGGSGRPPVRVSARPTGNLARRPLRRLRVCLRCAIVRSGRHEAKTKKREKKKAEERKKKKGEAPLVRARDHRASAREPLAAAAG